ncbi:hypothetical protein [Ruminococcus gauvreauii]|uniref:hypothetical protein n=1 Tax=Ruminococcus gauvreauii TaxID=438033 RepID=UPI003983DC79
MSRTSHPIRCLTLCAAVVLSAWLLTGCVSEEQKAVTDCIHSELDLLKTDNREGIAEHLSNSSLFDDMSAEKLPAEVIDVFSLFFKNFDYDIKNIQIDEDSQKASATLKLKTIDARKLAKDYTSQSIVKQLQNLANPSRVEYSLEDYYLTLHDLLASNDYETVTSDYPVTLTRTGETWKLERDSDLENALVGGFVTYAADPELFTPEEIVALHFDTIKNFDTEQMNQFLSLDELFSADDEYKRTIAKALAAQILQYLDYEITDSENDGITANVTMNITSCDSHSIISEYQESVAAYTNTAQALADGFSVRLSKANQILLDSITHNTSSSSTSITLVLVNDGTNWKLKMDDAVAEAILGNIDEAVAGISTDPDEGGSTESADNTTSDE